METLRRLQAELTAWLGKLSPRERVMVSAAAAAVAVFVVWLVSFGISTGISAREARIEEKTRVLAQVGKLGEGYRQRQAERQQLEARLKGPPIQLISFVSQKGTALSIDVGDLRQVNAPGELAGLAGLVEDAVEVNLAKVELARLARFLQALERDQGVVRVRRLRVTTRGDDPRLVDATFVVSTYRLKDA